MDILYKLKSGDSRTLKAKKNILGSIVIKGIDSLTYLLLVPVTLGYLNQYEYGIWLTLNSILMWINSFDIGLGNGLRNRLAEAMASGDKQLAKSYVSTTFFMLIVIMTFLIIIGGAAFPLIDWYSILNANTAQVPNLNGIVFVSFVIFCLNFIFKFIGNVYLALQLPAISNLLVTLGHMLSLIIIFFLTKTTDDSLMFVAVAYSISPLLVYLIAYPITFKVFYSYLAPSLVAFKKVYLKSLFSVGMQFFLLQISGVVLFAFSNIIISHMFGPDKVTPYNIAYRYFSIMSMVMAIIVSPMWSATTDAYVKGDIEWIKRSMQTIHKILLLAGCVLALMVIISPIVYKVWVGKGVEIPIVLSALMALYVYIVICSLSYSNFLNGLGKLRVQTINTVIVAILFLPIAFLLGEEMNIYGIVIAMCVVNASGLIVNAIQFSKIINNSAKGIWNL